MDKWAELRTAYQVAKLGTVSAAAEALGIHRATVNRHIDVLEEELGARVFIRHARGYTLTELGQDVLRVAQKTEELIDDLSGRVRGSKALIEGEIKLTILAPFSSLIMGAVAAFRAQNPHCRVSIDASEDLAKLEYGEAHIAVRAGPKPDHPDYVVQPFRRITFSLYAHDKYIERHGLPASEDDLEGHVFVGSSPKKARVPFARWMADHVLPEQLALDSANRWVNYEAVAGGIGLGFLGDHDTAHDSSFHRISSPNKAWSVALWLVTHVDLHRTEKVQSMLGFLKSRAA
ncbi:MAG: LysR family transcriptional regulator [Hyphomonas sp.]|nr:LysR family transcriptional regulator [Hyphomonas sp.]